MRTKAILLATGLMLSSPVMAQTAVQPKPVKDPNRVICERVEETGSRLAAKKICMTAAEWAAQRQADRDLTDHLQQQTYKNR